MGYVYCDACVMIVMLTGASRAYRAPPRRTAWRRDGAHDPADGGPATTAVPCAVRPQRPEGARPGFGRAERGAERGVRWRDGPRCTVAVAYRTITFSCSIFGF